MRYPQTALRPLHPLYLRRLISMALVTLTCFLTSCNVSGTEGPVWLGDPVIAAQLDSNGNPVKSLTTFDSPTTIVYCTLSIKGPEGFKMLVRWYLEDDLLFEEFVDFGLNRKVAPNLVYFDGQAIPPGNYRCEYSFGEDPLRTAEFTIVE